MRPCENRKQQQNTVIRCNLIRSRFSHDGTKRTNLSFKIRDCSSFGKNIIILNFMVETNLGKIMKLKAVKKELHKEETSAGNNL